MLLSLDMLRHSLLLSILDMTPRSSPLAVERLFDLFQRPALGLGHAEELPHTADCRLNHQHHVLYVVEGNSGSGNSHKQQK